MNSKIATHVLAAVMTVSALAACGKPSSSGSSPAALTNKAEGSIATDDFESAYADFSTVLANDPSNVRAKFWVSALAPMMELRGVYARLEPLASSTTQRGIEYRHSVAQFQAQNVDHPKLARFFTSGPKDIRTEGDAQELIARVTSKFNDFRLAMKSLRSEELTISNLPGVAPVQLNAADFEALQNMAAGYQVYLSVLNSYDLSGAVQASDESQGKTQAEALDAFSRNPHFGQLRDGRALVLVPEIAKDAVVAVREAISMQSTLCPKGQDAENNRPGHMFASGFCVAPTSALEATLKMTELLASTNYVNIPVNAGEKKTQIAINALGFTQSPIQNLRTLIPSQTDKCGEAVSFSDDTLGGLFPNGGVSAIAQANSKADCQ